MTELAQQGETLADAVQAMSDIPMDDHATAAPEAPREDKPAVAREADGRFKAQEQQSDKIQGDNAKQATAEDEDDWIEEPAEEEGKEPVRHKLSDVLAGYKETAKLRDEVAKFKSAPVLPAEIETALGETIKARQSYLDGLRQLHAMQTAPVPDLEMVNPSSQSFNPDAFHASVSAYQQAQQQRAGIEQHFAEVSKRQKEEQEAVRAARLQRETAKLKAFWPEVLTDKAAQAKAKEALSKHYGIDDAFLSSDLTLDHRIYALAKDALAYRESQAKSAEAVKVVRAKPRVIHGSARQSQNATQRASADGFSRLRETGSLEDAASALEGLF